jgi:hypothetical protein
MGKYLLAALFLLLFYQLFAFQNNYNSNNLSANNNDEYIEKFKSKLTIKTSLGSNGLIYSILPQSNILPTIKNNSRVNYRSYNPYITEISVNLYGLIGLAYRFNPFKNNKTKQSSYNDFNVGYYGRWLFIESYYNQYQDLYYSIGANRYKLLSENFNTDLRYFSLGFNNFFVFNYKRYSYNAAFSQSAIQKKSCGSFMLINYYNYAQTISAYGLIPAAAQPFYPTLSDLKTNRQITYSLSPGYGHTFVKNYFYSALSIFVGPAYQMQRYTTFTQKKFDASIGLFSRLKINVGYNHPAFFASLYLNAEQIQTTLYDLSTRQTLYNIGFTMGVRFIKKKK